MYFIKRPKVKKQYIRYTSKMNLIRNLFNANMNSKINRKLVNIKKDLSNLRNELGDVNNEFANLKSSLLELKNNYGYQTFIEIRKEQATIEIQKAYEKIYNTPIISTIERSTEKKFEQVGEKKTAHNNQTSSNEKKFSEPVTKALTVVKTRQTIRYFSNYQESCQIIFKININLNNIISTKFFHLKNMIYT